MRRTGNVLTERVVQSTYRTSDPDREMRIKLTVVDTGGEGEMSDKEAGVTKPSPMLGIARLRKAGLHKRACLYKGRGGLLDWFHQGGRWLVVRRARAMCRC
jgi:hypothetical protein